MQWQDEGFITRSINFQERSLRLFIFTRDHGLCTGIHRYTRSKSNSTQFQRGNLLKVKWQARLEEHLGEWRTELIEPFGGYALSFSAKKLRAFESALVLLTTLLPERMPMVSLYHDSLDLLEYFRNEPSHPPTTPTDAMDNDDYLSTYCRFEYNLLSHLGYGFNLDHAQEVILLNQSRGDYLTSASKRGEPFLPLPSFLLHDEQRATRQCKLQALQLLGYFLERLFISLKKTGLPAVRQQLISDVA